MAEQAMEVLKILGTDQLKYADRLNRYIDYKVLLGVVGRSLLCAEEQYALREGANDRS